MLRLIHLLYCITHIYCIIYCPKSPPLSAWLWMQIGWGRQSSISYCMRFVWYVVLASSVEIWQQNPILRRTQVFRLAQIFHFICHLTYLFIVFPCALWVLYIKVMWNPPRCSLLSKLDCQQQDVMWPLGFVVQWKAASLKLRPFHCCVAF